MNNNFGFTATSWASTLSRVSTIGGVLKEVNQERTLKKHEEMKQSWSNTALKINKQIFEGRKAKKEKPILRTQNKNKFQSVMMRDTEYVEKA